MAAPSNLSFETGAAGVAAGWALLAVSTFEAFADYGGSGLFEPFERFESGWDANDTYEFAFVPADLDQARYGTLSTANPVKTAENFEELWDSNESYVGSLDSPLPTAATYAPGAAQVEAFEAQWDSNQSYLVAFVGVGTDLVAGDFDAGAGTAETFDTTGWTTGFKTAFIGSPTDLSTAVFDGALTYEAIASERGPRQFSVNVATDVLTLVGSNPFASADKVTVTASGSYPAPLQASQSYYVRDLSGLTLKLSLTPGGTAIDITGTPDGAIYLTGDPTTSWTEKMVTTAF